MSAPPIGRISRNPKASDSSDEEPEEAGRLGHHEQHDQQDQQHAEPGIQQMLAGEDQRRPVTSPCSLAKATIEPVKVIAPIVSPIAISTRLAPWIAPRMPMP